MAKGKKEIGTQTFKDGTSAGAQMLAELERKLEKTQKDLKKKELEYEKVNKRFHEY